MKGISSFYSPNYPEVIVYMLQSTEYKVEPYLKWYWRTGDFRLVMKRRNLRKTLAARLLLFILWAGMLVQITAGFYFIWLWFDVYSPGYWQFGLALLLSYPIIWALLITVPIIIWRIFVIKPKEFFLIRKSKKIFANHPGVKIAVAGSYGKSTMKELLGAVLSESKNVAITPDNKSDAVSHARFARQLTGEEDVLVIEFGENKPGDVAKFTEIVRPNIGIITGLAPTHLDHYPSLKAAAEDIFSLAAYLSDKNVYVNTDSEAAKEYINDTHNSYGERGAGEWKIYKAALDVKGIAFRLWKGKTILQLSSGLIGRHQFGPVSAAAVIAHDLGLSKKQIEAGIAKTAPLDHHMQPRSIGNAWVIDDTYGGNIDGVKAGLALLKELPAKRKIYVMPGLVDQGIETELVHWEIGRLIADAKPDRVILMDNSVTDYILEGMKRAGYGDDKLKVEIIEEPLDFYTNLGHFVADGDLVLLQNDWTDNYS